MADEIRRELGGDDEIDRAPVALAQIEEPPRGRVRQDLVLRVPLERHAHKLCLVTARGQLPHELADVHFGAAVHERHLRFADDDRSGSRHYMLA
jgi:hypothetical protein